MISFLEYLEEAKRVEFNPDTMRWITIKDKEMQNQHIIVKKKDSTVVGGMGGKHDGKPLKDVFKAEENPEVAKSQEKKKEEKPKWKPKSLLGWEPGEKERILQKSSERAQKQYQEYLERIKNNPPKKRGYDFDPVKDQEGKTRDDIYPKWSRYPGD